MQLIGEEDEGGGGNCPQGQAEETPTTTVSSIYSTFLFLHFNILKDLYIYNMTDLQSLRNSFNLCKFSLKSTYQRFISTF